jgi:Domain of unknown function (DUF4129)
MSRPIALSPPLWLSRLFVLTARHLGVEPETGQTPRETASIAASALRNHATAAPLAEFPGRLVELYYRFRFGERSLSDEEQHAIEHEMSQLEAALRATSTAT